MSGYVCPSINSHNFLPSFSNLWQLCHTWSSESVYITCELILFYGLLSPGFSVAALASRNHRAATLLHSTSGTRSP
ncbi:hypothetical protein BJX68DRAFT_248697 [Aspergillus pseudodeflectus]|uniref:Uncharacterized protein n=1 Tax=Aspergillus pseudodeflectus TaxID=176178 RepID=A0ABR4JF63_9EURO